jgi:TolA-binding protein
MKIASNTNQNPPRIGLGLLLSGLLLLTSGLSAQESFSTQYARKFQNGTRLYKEARLQEAASEFRRAQETAVNNNDWAQALYWVILTELALADYGSAIMDMDELEKKAPNSSFNKDMVYHRARAYFNQGYFEDSLILFKRYNDNVYSGDPEASVRKAAAFFWMGECLYFMGQFDEAEKFYAWVIASYPDSPKNEAAGYRIDLIKQKKIEAELLALLRWSHEESLRTSEDYQRRIRTYEYTLNAYQRRIAELQPGGGQVLPVFPENLQSQNENYQFYDDSEENNYLLERAKLLGGELDRMIIEYEQNYGGAK